MFFRIIFRSKNAGKGRYCEPQKDIKIIMFFRGEAIWLLKNSIPYKQDCFGTETLN